MKLYCSTALAYFVLAVVVTDAAEVPNSDDNKLTMDVPQDISAVVVNPTQCGNGTIPITMFTIMPSEPEAGVSVYTVPPNLVTVERQSTALTFEWNSDVSSTAKEAGVLINVPANDLKAVTVEGGNTVNILNGFTTIDDLAVRGGSTMKVEMNTATAAQVNLFNSDGSTLRLVSSVPITKTDLDTTGETYVQAPYVENPFVYSGSKLFVSGNVTGIGGIVKDGAALTVDGAITGSLTTEGGATITTHSGCGGVSNNDQTATCSDDSSVTVDVGVGDLTAESQTGSGVLDCSSAPVVPGKSTAVAAVSATVAAIFTAMMI